MKIKQTPLLIRTLTQLRSDIISFNSPVTKKQLDDLIREIQSYIDSLSEIGEIESLRLQMAMDRLSKMIDTLGNLTKKISDTEQAILQNIKG